MSRMQRWIVRTCGGSTLVMSLAAAAAQADVGDHYRLLRLLDDASPPAIRGCLGPAAEPDALQRFLREALESRDPSRAAQFAVRDAPGVVLAAGGRWTCVPLSPQGFPRWPTEALHGLIVPVGVPAPLVTRWRRAILDQVAMDGVGRGLIVYPGGDAEQFIVIAEQGSALYVKFSRRLLRAGEYREDQWGAVLRHPGLLRVVTRSMGPGDGTPKRLAIPPHRLAQPVRDGFVLLDPTAATRDFAFAGTRWALPGTDLRLELHEQGRATRRSGGTLDHGTWLRADGVLHVTLADGTRYSLALSSDGVTLGGLARREEPGAADEEGDEWQWRVHLQRDGAEAGARTAAAFPPLPGDA